MKNKNIVGWAACAVAAIGLTLIAAETGTRVGFEYATIRWDGRDHTHIIRAGGKVEFIGLELRKAPKPNNADERSYYMNLAMNGLGQEGFEFVGMTPDEIVMRRSR